MSFSVITCFYCTFLSVNIFLRSVLVFISWQNLQGDLWSLFKLFAIGLFYDSTAFGFMLLPLFFLTSLLPLVIVFGLFFFSTVFTAVGEYLFWDELESRFNFIAVDYLVYTHEVIGNIVESYPVFPLLCLLLAISAVAAYVFYLQKFQKKPLSLVQALTSIALAVFLYFGVDSKFSQHSTNNFHNELSKNGTYSLFSSFLNNKLTYDQFYCTQKDPQKHTWMHIPGKERQIYPNVILVVGESLSASYLEAFGNKNGLTPTLNNLQTDSIFFRDLYAIGTRTVYGLTALTLSIPPVPGNAISRQSGNENLFSLGSIFKERGYRTAFIYGGYGYFDNMNSFFRSNGYETIDRTDFLNEEIHFANIWGVCDEDLYAKVCQKAAQTEPFFFTVMTTSNHRPFTYPDGRIDIPSHSGREGGVKYADYAISQFLAEAKKAPWFENTIFIFTADHTASSAGKTELSPQKYHIPLLIYAPKLLSPQEHSGLMSQIDIPPTLLGLLGWEYESAFFGVDVFQKEPKRAFIANYQSLGYLTEDSLTILKPKKQIQNLCLPDFLPLAEPLASERAQKAISYFEAASKWKESNSLIKP